MDDLFVNTKPSSFNRRTVALLTIVAAFALFNLCFNVDGHAQHWRNTLTGVCLAQPLLLGVWAAIGPPPAVKRLPATAVVLFLLAITCSFNGFVGNSQARLLQTLFILSGLFIGAACAMWIINTRTKWQIASQQQLASVSLNQFSLKYLIGLMTAVGVTLALGRFLISLSPSANTAGWNTGLTRIMWISAVILLGTLPIEFVPLVALSRRPSLGVAILLLIAWPVTTLSAVLIVTMLDRNDWFRITTDLITFQIGGTVAAAFAAIALRKGGYRLLSRNPASASS